MYFKTFLFATVFSVFSSKALAFDHLVELNTSKTIFLNDGDAISLSNLPSDWDFSRIAIGINSVSQNKLVGQLVIKDCSYRLDGSYKLVDFIYEKNFSVKYYGPTQNVMIQGWVDSAPVTAKCDTPHKSTEKDSIWQLKKNRFNFLFTVKTANYIDLASIESTTQFEGSSNFFKITELPKWNFNRIYILIEPLDGRKLNGYLYSGTQQSNIFGWSKKIALNGNNDAPRTFELAFPEYRKVKLKWWATLESPQQQTIKSITKIIGSDSIEAKYIFDNSISGNHEVKLKFGKDDFIDGTIPTVTKFDFYPDGILKIDSLESYDITGNIYRIQANLKKKRIISFALPLNLTYHSEIDSVIIMHQEDNNWKEIPIDSVANGFVYFRTNTFSNWIVRLGRKAKNLAADALTTHSCIATAPTSYSISETCRDVSGNVVSGAATSLNRFQKKIMELGVDIACLDIDRFKSLFSNDDRWNGVGAGSLNFNKITPELDPNYNEILNLLLQKRISPLIKLKNGKTNNICDKDDVDEVCDWKVTKFNLEILLADAIISQRDGNKRRFAKVYYDKIENKIFLNSKSIPIYRNKNGALAEHGNFTGTTPFQKVAFNDYFRTSSDFIENAAWFIKGLQKCMDIVNLDGIIVQRWLDFFNGFKNYSTVCQNLFNALHYNGEPPIEMLGDAFDCSQFTTQYATSSYNIMADKDDKLIAISESMVRISLLAWLDKVVFRDFIRLNYQKAYDGIHEWLILAGPLLMRNNIVAKAYASLTLFEYIFTGGETNLNHLNEALKKHYGPNGGYSEGMGYSQYIWDDVPYVLSALMDAYTLNGESPKVEKKFLKSPDYIFNFSRPVGKAENNSYYGLIPIEIDDGCTYNPDYRVWAKLKSDSKYLAISKYAPLRDDEKKNVLLPFGFPAQRVYDSKKDIPNRGKIWGSNKDGLLMITAVREEGADADTVALTMVAENGDLWKNGQTHDQQDNLSITLSSNKDGFIIQDRGYSGFGKRKDKNFHRYKNHNVVVPTGYDQLDNERISSSEIRKRVQDFTHKFAGGAETSLPYLYLLFEGLISKETDYSIALEGGAEASIEEHSIEDPRNGVVGYTASTSFDGSIENHRSILYFGGSFWVIDRPNATDLTWLANSLIENWDELRRKNLHLYGSTEIDAKKVSVENLPIDQHVTRIDYPDKRMVNYSYSVRDKNTNAFVMTYAVDSAFVRVTENCPTSCKCFENSTKDKRVIIPPLNEMFELCDAVPKSECTGLGKSSAITMFVKSSDATWNTGLGFILDGDLTTEENGVEVKLESVTLSRRKFSYKKSDGLSVSKSHNSVYLPANIILLHQ